MSTVIIPFLIITAMAVFIYFAFIKSNRRYLLKKGIPGVAIVTDIQKTMFTVGQSQNRVMRIVLDIEIVGNSYRQVTIKHAFDTLKLPKIGDKVNILIDPKKGENVILAAPDE